MKTTEDALDNLCEWASKWGMSFNVKKCKVMHIGHANKKGDYTMEGQTLTYLGYLVRNSP